MNKKFRRGTEAEASINGTIEQHVPNKLARMEGQVSTAKFRDKVGQWILEGVNVRALTDILCSVSQARKWHRYTSRMAWRHSVTAD